MRVVRGLERLTLRWTLWQRPEWPPLLGGLVNRIDMEQLQDVVVEQFMELVPCSHDAAGEVCRALLGQLYGLVDVLGF